jgi:hypothetical protein
LIIILNTSPLIRYSFPLPHPEYAPHPDCLAIINHLESGELTSASLMAEAKASVTTREGGADLFWLMIFRRSAREKTDVLVTLAFEPRCLEDRFGGICSAG